MGIRKLSSNSHLAHHGHWAIHVGFADVDVHLISGNYLHYPHQLVSKIHWYILHYSLSALCFVLGWYLFICSLHSKERIQYSKELCCIVRKSYQPIARRLIRVWNFLRRMMFCNMKKYINKLDMKPRELESVPRSESPYNYYNNLPVIHDSGKYSKRI